jgi:hypothetical protein
MRLKLTQKHRIDTNSCSTHDLAPHWPIPSHLPICRPILPSPESVPPRFLRLMRLLAPLIPPDHEILAILSHTARFAVFLEAEVFRTSGLVYREAVFAGSIINTTLFALLQMQKAPEEQENGALVVEALRLSLILWLGEVRRNFGIYPVINTIPVEKLMALLSGDMDWGEAKLIRMLVLAVAIIESEDEVDLRWLSMEWRKMANEIGIWDAKQAKKVTGVLWVKSVHDVKFLEKRKWLDSNSTLAP